MGLAERADLIVDFTNVPVGNYVLAQRRPGRAVRRRRARAIDFDAADPDSTGQVMQFRVVPGGGARPDDTAAVPGAPGHHPPHRRHDPTAGAAGEGGHRVRRGRHAVDGPAEALLGTGRPTGCRIETPVDGPGHREPRGRRHRGLGVLQHDRRRPPDAHPRGRLPGREPARPRSGRGRARSSSRSSSTGAATPPEPWENGWKDTVIAYPGQVTRLRLQFTNPGQFVWHCHIVEHEDNEMMRPYRIGPVQPGQPE